MEATLPNSGCQEYRRPCDASRRIVGVESRNGPTSGLLSKFRGVLKYHPIGQLIGRADTLGFIAGSVENMGGR